MSYLSDRRGGLIRRSHIWKPFLDCSHFSGQLVSARPAQDSAGQLETGSTGKGEATTLCAARLRITHWPRDKPNVYFFNIGITWFSAYIIVDG